MSEALSEVISLDSSHEEETYQIAERLIPYLLPRTLVTLCGELGSGKTHFVKGLARGLGYQDWRRITSPTFALLQSYECPKALLHHLDFYRLNRLEEVPDEFFEALEDTPGIVALEWGDRFPQLLLPPLLVIGIQSSGENQRSFSFQLPQNADQKLRLDLQDVLAG